jgi:hypothetical protein
MASLRRLPPQRLLAGAPDAAPAVLQRYLHRVSTRGLILAALLCGLAILAAFALQVSLLK